MDDKVFNHVFGENAELIKQALNIVMRTSEGFGVAMMYMHSLVDRTVERETSELTNRIYDLIQTNPKTKIGTTARINAMATVLRKERPSEQIDKLLILDEYRSIHDSKAMTKALDDIENIVKEGE